MARTLGDGRNCLACFRASRTQRRGAHGRFHQEGIITTLHALHEIFDREEYLVNLEQKLENYSRHLRMSLLLLSLYSEIENPAVLDRIIEEIQQVRYLHSIVVALGGAPEEAQFRHAKEYFGRLRTRKRDLKMVWVDGPGIQRIFQEVQKREIPTGVQGKGQSVWIALGYLFAREDAEVIALHNCDIVTYDRVLLGQLIEPTANPNNDFEFCKGYYARISPTERAMKGRVTRLFVTPFVDAMQRIAQNCIGFPEDRNEIMLSRFDYRTHSLQIRCTKVGVGDIDGSSILQDERVLVFEPLSPILDLHPGFTGT